MKREKHNTFYLIQNYMETYPSHQIVFLYSVTFSILSNLRLYFSINSSPLLFERQVLGKGLTMFVFLFIQGEQSLCIPYIQG